MQFRCFNNVNRFRKPENTMSPHSGRTRRLRIPENTHITSNTHPRPFSQCSPHRLFGGGGTSRSRSGACRLTSLLSRRRGAQPCLSAASDTQSRPLSFRMQYLYARCAASHLLPLPRAASIAPLRRAGVSVCPPFASKTDPEPPRAPFSPNTYPAWGAEHPRTGARRAP